MLGPQVVFQLQVGAPELRGCTVPPVSSPQGREQRRVHVGTRLLAVSQAVAVTRSEPCWLLPSSSSSLRQGSEVGGQLACPVIRRCRAGHRQVLTSVTSYARAARALRQVFTRCSEA